jgi:uncharacterized repeat protein (TIGR03803 family)
MKRLLLHIFLLITICKLSIVDCSAQYTTLINFNGTANGNNPIRTSLVSDGTFLWGMTYQGGTKDSGVVFKMDPTTINSYTVVHEFSNIGGNPSESLIFDGTDMYGMTQNGGVTGDGIVFKINTSTNVFSVVYNFINTNGSGPTGSLIYDGTAFYGMTEYGGAPGSSGVVFKLKKDGSYTKLLDFNGANGANPRGSLFYDGTYLYGMTRSGGSKGKGVIFKIKPDGSAYAKMFDFSGIADGEEPYGSLVSDGTFLYGMTLFGGGGGFGNIFKINKDGTQYANLYAFLGFPDGRKPYGNLIFRGGFLYGMTSAGGTEDQGLIFKIRTNGSQYTKLYSFDSTIGGYTPFGSLILDGTSLYGLTYQGGLNSLGTAFKYGYCTTVASSQSVTVCAGQSYNIGVHTYTTSGIYKDTLSTVVNGCDSVVTTNLTISLDVPPTVSITGVTTICKGGTTTLTASTAGAISYMWYSGPSTSAYAVSPTANKGYTVVAIDANACTGMATKTVTVNSLPSVAISGPAAICIGATATLTGTGAVSYVWSYASTDNAIVVSPTTNTSYTVTGTDVNSCVNAATKTVTINYPVSSSQTITLCAGQSLTVGVNTYTASGTYVDVLSSVLTGCDSTVNTYIISNGSTPSVVSITGLGTICNGASTTLTGSGAVSYVWASGGETTTAIVVSPTSNPTTYTVTGTDANSCVNSKTISVTVNGTPTVSITGNAVICNGTNTTLTASGAVSYVWASGGQSTTAIVVSPTTGVTYTVTGTDANSCVNSKTISVTVNATPTVSITGSTTICNGANTTLTGSGAVSYVWASGGQTTTAIVVSPTNNTTYTVTGTDANSCMNSKTISVTVNATPTVSITGGTTICNGASTTLTGSGAVSYVWASGGQTTTAIVVSPTNNATYTVTGTDANSCVNSKTISVMVNATPTVSITGSTTICNGANTTLTGMGAVSYVWASGGQTTTAIVVSPTNNATYTVTGTDASSCMNSKTISVTVNATPTVSITGSTTICNGANTTLTGSGAVSYVWASGGQTTTAIVVSPTNNTTYTVTGTDASSCMNSKTISVTVNTTPTVSVTGNTTICNGANTTLTGSGAVSYVWASGGQTTTAIVVSPTNNTTYTVTGTDANSCKKAITTTVTVNPLPNISTSLSGIVVSANQNGAVYQWLNCNNSNLPISGATNQSYTATVNGSYAVKVTLGSCPDTSSCVAVTLVDVNDKSHTNSFVYYPNPSTGVFSIATSEKEYELNICNFLGEKILSRNIQSEKIEINLSNQPDGVYFLQLRTEQGTVTKKLVIQK